MAPAAELSYKHDKTYYPDFKEFMTALQDPGKPDKKNDGLMDYPKVKKMCGKLVDLLQKSDFCEIPKKSNKHRNVHECVKRIICQRKHVDLIDVHEKFRPYAGKNDKVYILRNDTEYWGFDLVLQDIVTHFAVKEIQKQNDRNGSDAIRVAAIMLLPENRGPVNNLLKGTKTTRAQSDQAVDPDLAWAIQAVETFKDPTFEVEVPHKINPDDIEGIDPNDDQRICMPRDGKWFLNTWRHYLRKKYKDAIGRWDKDTGGGGREPSDFADFCQRDSRWMVWVYLMDLEADFLLFSNAKGKPPEYVGREAGFSNRDEDDNQENNNEGGVVSVSPKKRKSDRMLMESRRVYEERTSNMMNLMERMSSMLEAHAPQINKWKSATDLEAGQLLQAICDAGKRKRELEETTQVMSPRTRACILGGIDRDIVDLGDRYRELVTSSNVNPVAAVDHPLFADGGCNVARRLHQPDPPTSSDEEEDPLDHSAVVLSED